MCTLTDSCRRKMIPVDVENRFIKILAGIAGALAVAVVCYLAGHREGSRQAHAEDATRYAAELARVEKVYREKEEEHANEAQKARVAYAEVVAAAKSRADVVAADIASGVRVVRVRSASCAPMPATTAAATGTNEQRAGELSGEAGARLYNLASDCNRVARKLNALQEAMNAAVKLCNGGKP